MSIAAFFRDRATRQEIGAAELAPARPLLFEWCVAALAVGIGLYFAWPVEPDWRFGAVAFGFGILALRACLHRLALYTPLLFAVFVLAGFSRAALHTHSVSAPVLEDYRQSYTVTGWVEAVEKSGKGFRWRIVVDEMSSWDDKLPASQTPVNVRIKTKTVGFVPGDAVTLRALMTGPPGPVIADGYDPARGAFFDQVGGYGFAIGSPVEAEVEVSGWNRFRRARTRFRHKLTSRILERAPPETAGLQAALLTGERAYIPEVQVESLRGAGLAHILAISGLHMGLVAGGAFFFVTLILAAIDPIARRYDVRKFAAVIGMLIATFYLGISTGTVSIQRAYIMGMVMFAAVLLGRPAISMRSVAIAAIITLFLHPEVLVSAGFQMSFAAVAALVAVYALWRERFPPTFRAGLITRVVNNMTGLGVTSLVAGAATGGFAAMHFHYVTRYGFFANLAAMPIFTFIIMPAGFISVLLMPLGLEGPALAVMGQGLELMLFVSDWASSLPKSRVFFPAAPAWAIGIYGLGFLLLCLGPLRLRVAGLGCMLAVFIIWSQTEQPDMRVSDSANIAFWETGEDGRTLYVERKRADRYGLSQFTERAGEPDADIAAYSEAQAKCDVQACRIEVKGRVVAVVATPEAVLEECANADLVLLTERAAGPIVRRRCAGKLIDLRRLVDEGAQDIYLLGDEIRFKTANPEKRKRRPWGRKR